MDSYTKPDWFRSVLLTIDVQRDTTVPGSPIFIPGTLEIIPNLELLLSAYRSAMAPIIHVIRLYLADGSNVDLCRRSRVEGGVRMLAPGAEGSQIVDGLLPKPPIDLDTESLLQGKLQKIGDKESIIYKPRWGAFYKTELEERLRELGVNTIVFSGCNFPNCPRTSVYEASERDFRVVLVRDAVSGLYDRGIEELQGIGVTILTTEECVNTMRSL
ncbi:MAG: cysteine hydrolase [Pseudomonadota bacterium]